MENSQSNREVVQEIKPEIGEFTWMWTQDFFVETKAGNYIWKSPEYGGDNTIQKHPGTYEEYCNKINVSYGRCKGYQNIEKYCPGVKWI